MGKILLVDDHPHIVKLLEMALVGEGHEILTAENGEAGLRLVREARPDVVILDVVMPELDGLRVLNRIKTDPELKETVVVMLTVRDHPEEVTLGLDIGADYYVAKPFRPSEITSLVRRIFETRGGHQSPPSS
jgi:DNA-binding response OmpR family regulator